MRYLRIPPTFGLTEVSAVIKKTFRICFRWVLLLCFANSLAWSKDAPPASSSLTIAVHNDAGVSAAALAQAGQVVRGIFHQAGLEVDWVDCGTPADTRPAPEPCRQAIFPTRLQLRIVLRPRNLSESTFGVSYLSADAIGCYSYLFFAQVQELHENYHAGLGNVLGHVAAHEIAHLLLGTNSHSPVGIMRAQWHAEELASASRGALLFTPAQSRSMRERLDGTPAEWKRASVAPATPSGF